MNSWDHEKRCVVMKTTKLLVTATAITIMASLTPTTAFANGHGGGHGHGWGHVGFGISIGFPIYGGYGYWGGPAYYPPYPYYPPVVYAPPPYYPPVVAAPVVAKPAAVIRQDAITSYVNVLNSNGSVTPVRVRRFGNVWVGPRGEQYLSYPTPEQLKPVYGF
jgi:hypothetical protein